MIACGPAEGMDALLENPRVVAASDSILFDICAESGETYAGSVPTDPQQDSSPNDDD
jgi:hypothetical protein